MSTNQNTSKRRFFFNHSPVNPAYMQFFGLPAVTSAESYLFAFKSVPPQLAFCCRLGEAKLSKSRLEIDVTGAAETRANRVVLSTTGALGT